MSEFLESEFLQISGIQHFSFCPRQWALIHIEGLWNENYHTLVGRLMHKKTHDSTKTEKRGDKIIARALKTSSANLGISGECDVVEFHKNSLGIPLKNWEGQYLPFPIEYKKGRTKEEDHDRLQLCAQAMCLEEMLCCNIEKGAIFYGEPKRREQILFTEKLRTEVKNILLKMHELYKKGNTPKVKARKNCISCSMAEYCLPSLTKNTTSSVEKYLEDSLL